jgi:hypothetical protein
MALKKDKLSDAQKAELERLRPFIARQGLVARMNGAAWRAALDAVLGIEGFTPLYRVRCVRDSQDPPEAQWSGPLPQGLPLYNFIEWLEINPRPARGRDCSAALAAALDAAGAPWSATAGGIRIIGYERPKPAGPRGG